LEPATFARLLQEGKEMGQRNRQIIQDWMSNNSLFKWVLPGGGFTSFPSFNMPVSSWDLCCRLLADPYATYMVPGVCYGNEFDSNVRLGFGSLTPSIQAGLAQLDIFAGQVAVG
jgi:hypothetical protein